MAIHHDRGSLEKILRGENFHINTSAFRQRVERVDVAAMQAQLAHLRIHARPVINFQQFRGSHKGHPRHAPAFLLHIRRSPALSPAREFVRSLAPNSCFAACGRAFARQVNFLTPSPLLATKSPCRVLCQLLNTSMVTGLADLRTAQARSSPPARNYSSSYPDCRTRPVPHSRYSAKIHFFTIDGKAVQKC